MCELYEDFVDDTSYKFHTDISDLDDNFLIYYKLYDKDAWNLVIVSTYYSLTSLTTVGLGDYRPINNTERVVCTFILLFGVAIFSLIMS